MLFSSIKEQVKYENQIIDTLACPYDYNDSINLHCWYKNHCNFLILVYYVTTINILYFICLVCLTPIKNIKSPTNSFIMLYRILWRPRTIFVHFRAFDIFMIKVDKYRKVTQFFAIQINRNKMLQLMLSLLHIQP